MGRIRGRPAGGVAGDGTAPARGETAIGVEHSRWMTGRNVAQRTERTGTDAYGRTMTATSSSSQASGRAATNAARVS